MIKNPRIFLIAIITALAAGLFFRWIYSPLDVHTYRVMNYNGDVQFVKATSAYARGPAIVLTKSDGGKHFFIDVAEIEEIN